MRWEQWWWWWVFSLSSFRSVLLFLDGIRCDIPRMVFLLEPWDGLSSGKPPSFLNKAPTLWETKDSGKNNSDNHIKILVFFFLLYKKLTWDQQIWEFLQISSSWMSNVSLNGLGSKQIHFKERIERFSSWLPAVDAWHPWDLQYGCCSWFEPPAYERLSSLTHQLNHDERSHLAQSWSLHEKLSWSVEWAWGYWYPG